MKKILGLKKMFKKILGPKKNFGPKKLWGQKNCGAKKKFLLSLEPFQKLGMDGYYDKFW